jgi:hypothetical protein
LLVFASSFAPIPTDRSSPPPAERNGRLESGGYARTPAPDRIESRQRAPPVV